MLNRIWDGKYNSNVIKYYKISFCTTCMGRLYNLKETLPKNIESNKLYPHVEFVILDYNSNDGLEGWMKENMMKYIEDGIVSYYRTDEPKYFSMAHSRNIAFKVARGDIVNNVDADNYTFDINNRKSATECLASCINRMANDSHSKTFFAKGKRSMHGRIGFYKDEFINDLGGYDESLLGYGHDDHDLVQRAWALGYIMYWWGGVYCSRINTSKNEKNKNMERPWKVTEQENKIKSAENIARGVFKANVGNHWGKATLIKNFTETIRI